MAASPRLKIFSPTPSLLTRQRTPKETGDEELYAIVGSQEANPMECRISDDSPFGKALLGHKVGDIVEVEAPIGVLKYKILTVEK